MIALCTWSAVQMLRSEPQRVVGRQLEFGQALIRLRHWIESPLARARVQLDDRAVHVVGRPDVEIGTTACCRPPARIWAGSDSVAALDRKSTCPRAGPA